MRQGFKPLADYETSISAPGEPSECHTYKSHPQPLLQLFIKLREISQENCIFSKFFARIYYTAELVLM
jgi:hypothetical protein